MRLSSTPVVAAVLLCAVSLLAQSPTSEVKTKAEGGDVPAQVSLARAYEKGEGVTQNDDLAAKWYRAAAEKGDAEAQNRLGVLYRLGRGVEQDKERAVEWYRKAAKQGYGPAMFNLGTSYYNGDGVATSDNYAYVWFFMADRAAGGEARDAVARMEADLPPSRLASIKLLLADILRQGNDVPKNPALAFQVLSTIANESAVAKFEIGRMYAEGEGVAQDTTTALKYLNASDIVRAKLYLSEMYLEGRGVAKDVNKAIELLQKSGGVSSDVNVKIAALYWSGNSVPQDYKKALKYYDAAAGVGDALALYMLGTAARDGLGTRKSAEDMCMYYVLSANGGSAQGKAEAQRACQGASLEKAKKKATDWLSKHPEALRTFRARLAEAQTP